VSSGFSQFDDVSQGVYKALLLQKTWQKLDLDHNQKFTETDGKKTQDITGEKLWRYRSDYKRNDLYGLF